MSTLPSNTLGRDISGGVTYSVRPGKRKYSVILNQNTVTTFTLPTTPGPNKNWDIRFSYEPGTTVWVAYDGDTVAVPAGATIAVTTSELLPAGRIVASGTQIGLITSNTTAEVGFTLDTCNS